MALAKDEHFLMFQPEDSKSVMTQIGKDVALLCQFGFMDYSLFFTVEYNPEYVKRYPQEFKQDKYGNLV